MAEHPDQGGRRGGGRTLRSEARTTASIWEQLPISDRTIQTRWSGDAWQTEGNYELLPEGSPVENMADRLGAGDLLPRLSQQADQSRHRVREGQVAGSIRMVPIDIAGIGEIDANLNACVKRCERIIFEGPHGEDHPDGPVAGSTMALAARRPR